MVKGLRSAPLRPDRCGADDHAASPKGGQPLFDPKSDALDAQTNHTRRFKGDRSARVALASMAKLGNLILNAYDAVFFPLAVTAHCGIWPKLRTASA